jgi:hypothetical protein
VWLHKLESVCLSAIKSLQCKLKHGRRQKCALLQGTMKFVFVVGLSATILTMKKQEIILIHIIIIIIITFVVRSGGHGGVVCSGILLFIYH